MIEKLEVTSDDRFTSHFRGSLLQVFLYVTDECNLRCKQCYYKPWLKPGHAEMPTTTLLALLSEFRRLGARKLSLLGGEPTLYGQAPGNDSISDVLVEARSLGFEFIRLVTNGLFDPSLLQEEGLRTLDELTFSVDGDTPDLHDSLRGRGTFQRTLANVRSAVAAGYNVQITTCVHRGNIGRDHNGDLLLDRAIRWAETQGATVINFHPLFKMDIPRDSWSGPTDVQPEEWTAAYNELRQKVDAGEYVIAVRLPQRFVPVATFYEAPEYFGFCPVKLRERIEVHPNGQIHSCALNNGTPNALAHFSRDDNRILIRWAQLNNELRTHPFDLATEHPCAVMSRNFDGLSPLCISFKPAQDEFAWRSHGLR